MSLTVKLYYNLLSHKVIGHSSAINLVSLEKLIISKIELKAKKL